MRLCFIVDVSIAWMAGPLRRRGFLVFEPHRDYPPDARDEEICEWAWRTGCVVVSSDPYFEARGCGVHIPKSEEYRRNSWELVTLAIKRAALLAREQLWHEGGQ